MDKSNKKFSKKTLIKIILLINIVAFGYLSLLLIKHQVLPQTWRYSFLIVGLVIHGLLAYLSFKTYKKESHIYPPIILMIIIALTNILLGLYISKAISTVDQISSPEPSIQEEVRFSFVALKDSAIDSLNRIEDYEVLVPQDQDKENTDAYLKELILKKKMTVTTLETKSYGDSATKLLGGQGDLALINEVYRPLILEEHPDFEDKTKIVDFVTLKVAKPKEKDGEKNTIDSQADRTPENQSFSLYISGIDTYGTIDYAGRSDVNIIMTVDPKTNKILLVSVPRDSYVQIPGPGANEYDKLTHAGIYGIESSQQALENLFDIKIDYYVKTNFSSLIDIVDILGGIQVENPIGFQAGSYYFDQGKINLNGDQALRYSRERYNLEKGDIDRGQNQTRVIQGIIDKAVSPAILTNYDKVLSVAEKSTKMNIPKEKIIELINKQLQSGKAWEVERTYLEGRGTSGLSSYAMPGYSLYMYQLDPDSVEQVSKMINAINSN